MNNLRKTFNMINKRIFNVFFALFLLFYSHSLRAQSVWLEELDLTKIDQIIHQPHAGKNVMGKPIKIDGRVYEHGLGLEAHSACYINLHKSAKSIYGIVGFDQSQEYHPAFCKTKLYVVADDKIVWISNELGFGSDGEAFNVSLDGVETLQLWVLGNKGNFRTATNLADCKIIYSGTKPELFSPQKSEPYLLTPKALDSPRINGARVFGARPGSPVLFQIAVSGKRPIKYSAKGLPEGLNLNTQTGIISGKTTKKGSFWVKLLAENSFGKDTSSLRVEVGTTVALTPPMGWSSWNVWGENVSQEKVLEALNQIKAHKLDQYGWNYINIDDGWQGKRGGKYMGIQANEKFPDIRRLIDSIHASGMKFGIYSSPWKTTYAGMFGASKSGFMGSSSDLPNGTNEMNDLQYGVYPFHKEDVKQWTDWGVDFVKYDWWPNDVPHTKAMTNALNEASRDMVFSISNAAPIENAADWKTLTNLWRTTGDIQNSWPCVLALGFSQKNWLSHTCPGHWNDPDMLILGDIGIGEPITACRLSADEQYAHVSLWGILSAPLILGCDLSKLDDFTLNLLTNNEVISINQDPLASATTLLKSDGIHEIYVKPMANGSKAVAFFNRGLNTSTIELDLNELGFKNQATIRDVWRQKDVAKVTGVFKTTVNGHGVAFYRISN
jgi:alpha-galactosidase